MKIDVEVKRTTWGKFKIPHLAILHALSTGVGIFALLELGYVWGLLICIVTAIVISNWTDKEYIRILNAQQEAAVRAAEEKEEK